MPRFDVEAHGRRYEVEAPSIEAATAALVGLPEGFVLDQAPAAVAAPPPGFVLDTPTSGKGAPQAVTPDQRGIGERVGEMFTGTARTEFPDAPEFGAALTEAARAAGRGTSHAGPIAASLITPDPQAQLDILRKQIPGLEHKQDVAGNIMLRLPGEGVNDWTYLNRPGATARDAGEAGAQALTMIPALRALRFATTVPRALAIGGAGMGATSAAQDVAATAAGSEQGLVDLPRAAVSTVLGAVTAPGVPSAAARAVTAPFRRGAASAETEAARQAGAAELRDRAAPGAHPLPPGADRALVTSDAVDIGVDLPRAATGGLAQRTTAQAMAQVPFVGTPWRARRSGRQTRSKAPWMRPLQAPAAAAG